MRILQTRNMRSGRDFYELKIVPVYSFLVVVNNLYNFRP